MKAYHIAFERDPKIYFDEAIFTDQLWGNDLRGIPLLLWHNRLHPFPVQIAQWGLYKYNLGLKDDKQMEQALLVAEYLAQNLKNGFWDMGIGRPRYSLKPPWPSAMAQGEGISLLARAYKRTQKEFYAEKAIEAFKIMEMYSIDGGVLSSFPDGSPALEEYPSRPQSLVLNGMLFAIFGVYDFVEMIDCSRRPFLADLLKGLSENIHRYDMGFWSKYDLYQGGMISSKIYHNLHIEQLDALMRIDKRDIWQSYKDRWHKYSSRPLYRLFRDARRTWEKLTRTY